MKLNNKRAFLLCLFLLFIGWNGFAQPSCGPGQAPCGRNNTCRPVNECRGGPPPPGLVVPIDSHISFLLISGIGLGIFFFASNRNKVAA